MHFSIIVSQKSLVRGAHWATASCGVEQDFSGALYLLRFLPLKLTHLPERARPPGRCGLNSPYLSSSAQNPKCVQICAPLAVIHTTVIYYYIEINMLTVISTSVRLVAFLHSDS